MGEITVEVDGVEHIYHLQESLVCERCDSKWLSRPDDEPASCPACEEETAIRAVAEELVIRPKWLWDGAASIEEMAARTGQKAKVLRKLENDGWILDRSPRDGYAHLSKPVEQDERADEMGVVASEE